MPLMNIITKEQVKFAKIAANISSRQICEDAKIGKATLERFESGKSSPSIATLVKIKSSVDMYLDKAGWELMDNGGIQPKQKPISDI